MAEQFARLAPFMEVQRRQRYASSQVDVHNTWINHAIDKSRCHMALARTTILIALGGSSPVTTTWSGDQFFASDGSDIPYGVEVLPTGLISSGSTYVVTAQDSATVTVTVTAAVALAIGTQFIVHGCARLPTS